MKMSLFGFSKNEKIIVLGVLLVILTLSFFNFKTALRRRRDFQRKEDVRNITEALEFFKIEYGLLPESKDGQIVGCRPRKEKVNGKEVIFFEKCVWGQDKLGEFEIPGDPKTAAGFAYTYLATPKRYQVFASLESADEAEYDPAIVKRGISCGVLVCNFGLGDVPLDKSLEEYENEISED